MGMGGSIGDLDGRWTLVAFQPLSSGEFSAALPGPLRRPTRIESLDRCIHSPTIDSSGGAGEAQKA